MTATPASQPTEVVLPITLDTTQADYVQISVWTRARKSLLKAKWPLVALAILTFFIFLGIFGPNITPRDPNKQSLVTRNRPPMNVERNGQVMFPLGSDALGRDVLTRLIYGARVSLAVGFTAVVIGGLLGTSVGMIAGYFGGWIDDLIMRLADIQLAFPFILLATMVLVVLGPGVINLVLTLGIAQWVTYARIARGQVISQREKEYVEAVRSVGASHWRILFQALLPNIIAPIVVIASFNVASVILAEATLSFLGLGVPPTVPTWGGMLNESRDSLLGGTWWLAVFPTICIMLTVLSLNILGDWLRDFLDPRLRGRGS
jgi:peptide/nickel transport system permease protein